MSAFTAALPKRLPPRVSALYQDLLLLMARLFPAAVFLQSGRTKLNGWQLNDSAVYLFREEYR